MTDQEQIQSEWPASGRQISVAELRAKIACFREDEMVAYCASLDTWDALLNAVGAARRVAAVRHGNSLVETVTPAMLALRKTLARFDFGDACPLISTDT